eukprot:gene4869-5947_t
MRGPSSGFAALADCDPEALLEEEETRASAQAGSRITDTSKAASRGNKVHPRYDALPAVSEVTIDGTESYRRVRQDSKEWAELHAGVLTTGLLSDALGLRESMVEEVGLCMLTPEGLRQQLGDRTPTGSLPPLGASPDGVIWHPHTQCDGDSATAEDGRRNRREVLEVKNLCPFDEWYPNVVSAQYWPEKLQLEMLAAGTGTALLAMDSAHHGIHLFRVARDDAYLQQMLQLLSDFYTRYVQTGREPPEDMFIERADYRTFIQASGDFVGCIADPEKPNGSDKRWFLDE